MQCIAIDYSRLIVQKDIEDTNLLKETREWGVDELSVNGRESIIGHTDKLDMRRVDTYNSAQIDV